MAYKIQITQHAMKVCQRGKEMLHDLKRSEWLPVYDEEGVRVVSQEMKSLWDKLYTTLEGGNRDDIPDKVKVSLVFHHQCLLRDRKYMLAYHHHRLAKIRQLRWQAGGVMPERIRSLLSPFEMQFFNEYSKNVSEYMESVDLDLTSDLEPPKELNVEVRAIQDCGDIMTDQGTVRLDKGTIHFLRRADISFERAHHPQELQEVKGSVIKYCIENINSMQMFLKQRTRENRFKHG